MFEYTFSFQSTKALKTTIVKVFAKDYDAAVRRAQQSYMQENAYVDLIEIKEVV